MNGGAGALTGLPLRRGRETCSPSWPALGRGCQPNCGLGYMSSGALNIGAFPTEEKAKQSRGVAKMTHPRGIGNKPSRCVLGVFQAPVQEGAG